MAVNVALCNSQKIEILFCDNVIYNHEMDICDDLLNNEHEQVPGKFVSP